MKIIVRAFRSVSYAFLLLIISEAAAHGDVGLPMIFVTLPSMIIALIPVILIEAFVLGRKLGVAPLSVLKSVSIANFLSTLIGIPAVWILLLLIEIVIEFTVGNRIHGINRLINHLSAVTWEAPWIPPYGKNANWIDPAAMLFLLIPFFFASWQMEERIVRHYHQDISPAAVNKGMLAANAASYLSLGLLVLCWLLKEIH